MGSLLVIAVTGIVLCMLLRRFVKKFPLPVLILLVIVVSALINPLITFLVMGALVTYWLLRGKSIRRRK